MDLSKLSNEDLLALKSGDLSKVSNEGLMALKGVAPPKAPGFGSPQDFVSGVNRTIGTLGDAVIAGYNLLLPKSQEVQPLSAGMQSAGIDLERPRSFLGIAGEYAMPGPGGAVKNVVQTGLAAAGGYAGRSLNPDSALSEFLGSVAAVTAPTALAGATRAGFRGLDPTKMQQNVARADAINAPVTVGTASGNPLIQILEKISGSVPGGVGRYRKAGEDAAAAIKARLETITGGAADDTVKAGRVIEKGLFDDVTGWTARSKATRDGLYAKLDAKVGSAVVPANNTESFMQGANKGVAGAPALSNLLFTDKNVQAQFDALTADLTAGQKQIPYEALKQLRTEVGDALGDPQLIGSTRRTLLKDFYKALSDDMREAAISNGGIKEFERANQYHKARVARIEDFYEALNKKVAPEDVWNSAVGDSPKSATRLAAIRKALEPKEWDYVRRTLITRMGKPVASAATEEGVGFSAGTFLTNYERMKSKGTLDAVFGKGQYRKDIDEVAKYASGLRDSAAVLANPSGTAALGLTASVYYGALGMAGGLFMGGNAAGLGAIAAGTLSNAAVARLLNNQKFVHWLAQSTRIPPQAAPDHLRRLAVIIGNDEEVLPDVEAYIDATRSLLQE